MIIVIGDTPEELAKLQSIIDTGILNTAIEEAVIDVTYRLASGNTLLVNAYNHIVGEKVSSKRNETAD
jgi:hypothetical protein